MTVIPKSSCGNAIIWIDTNGNKLCYVLFSDLVISQHCLTANNYHNGRCYTRSIMCHQATMGIIIHIYINSRYIVFAYSTVMLYRNQNERKGAIFIYKFTNTPHASSLRVSYEPPFLSSLEKIYLEISRVHYISYCSTAYEIEYIQVWDEGVSLRIPVIIAERLPPSWIGILSSVVVYP